MKTYKYLIVLTKFGLYNYNDSNIFIVCTKLVIALDISEYNFVKFNIITQLFISIVTTTRLDLY